MYRLRGLGSYFKELVIVLRAKFYLHVLGRSMFGSQWAAMERFMDAPAGTAEVAAYESKVSKDLLRIFYVANEMLYRVDTLERVKSEDVGNCYFRCPCQPGQNGSFILAKMQKAVEVPCTD